MAASDAKPIPQKNVAHRITFPILDADGDLVTGATGLDSEVSKDGGTFTDCTSEATEIATSSGMYFLDLTASEMNADTVAVIVKTTSAGAKTTPIVMYPQEADDIRVSVTYWSTSAIATPDTAGYPKVTIKSGTGTGEINLASGVADADVREWLGTAAATPTVAGVPEVDVTHWLGTAAATPTVAGVPEVDVTHYGGTAGTFASGRPEVNTTHAAGTAWGSGAITAASIATDAIGSAEIAAAAANKIADHVWRRTYANARASSDGDAVALRSGLGMMGRMINKWSISGTTLTIYQEDDTTSTAPGGTMTLTATAGADPITAMDP